MIYLEAGQPRDLPYNVIILFAGGNDIVDYPLTVVPRRQGFFTGAVVFVAQAVSRPHR